jgi:hypothetical protein
MDRLHNIVTPNIHGIYEECKLRTLHNSLCKPEIEEILLREIEIKHLSPTLGNRAHKMGTEQKGTISLTCDSIRYTDGQREDACDG